MNGAYKKQMAHVIGIGVPRAASTWLFEHLATHPSISPSNIKETKFFNDPKKFQLGYREYLKYFSNYKEDSILFEFDPSYFYSSEAPNAIKSIVPNAKLIIILRNPIDRALSHYLLHLNKAKITLHNPEHALFEYENRYLKPGLYALWLERCHEYFDKKNILVIKFEEIESDPLGVLGRCAKFLSLKPYDYINVDSKVNYVGEKAAVLYSLNILLFSILKFSSKLPRSVREIGNLLNLKSLINKLRIINQAGVSHEKVKTVDISTKLRKRLEDYYRLDVDRLSILLDFNFNKLWNIGISSKSFKKDGVNDEGIEKLKQ